MLKTNKIFLITLWILLGHTAWSNDINKFSNSIDPLITSEIYDYLLENKDYRTIARLDAWQKISKNYLAAIVDYGEIIDNYSALQIAYKPPLIDDLVNVFDEEYREEHQQDVFMLFMYFKFKQDNKYLLEANKELLSAEASYISNIGNVARTLIYTLEDIDEKKINMPQSEINALITKLNELKEYNDTMKISYLWSYSYFATESYFLFYEKMSNSAPSELYDFMEERLNKPFDDAYIMRELDALYPSERS